MKYQVTTIGDCLKDIFVFAPSKILTHGKMMGRKRQYLSFPYGGKTKIDEIGYDLGGSSCNASVAMSRLGIKTSLATIIGSDTYSRESLEVLKAEKVGTSFIKKEKENSLGFSIVLTGETGDRSILTKRFDYNFKKIDLKKVFSQSDSIYVSGINKNSSVLQKEIIRLTRKTKKPLYINPSSYQLNKNKTGLRKMIRFSEAMCLNLVEALVLVGKNQINIRNLLISIRKMGASIVIITAGKRGAFCYDGDSFYRVGIRRVESLDSTGSGDAFFSTFISARINGRGIDDALILAAINASSMVSSFGAQKNLLKKSELNKIFKKNKVTIRKF